MNARTLKSVAIILMCGIGCCLICACNRQATTSAPASRSSQLSSTGVGVELHTDPDPPRSGENAVEVLVKSADGTPMTDVTVSVAFSMPPMPSMNMPAMRSVVDLKQRDRGVYRGDGQLSMAGAWNVIVTVSRDGEPIADKRFTVFAR